MVKNMQFKIILIFFIVGIILIGSLGAFYIYSLNGLNEQISNSNITNLDQVTLESIKN